MAVLRRRVESDDGEGAPEWMLTFSDCMTLLLTFFVLLLSFSSFDERTFRKLKSILGGGMPSVRVDLAANKDAFLPTNQVMHTPDLDRGSEKPTLADGSEDNLKEETEPADFSSRKVFVIPSRNVFWGRGQVISQQGRKTLSTIASLLKEAPHRIVISECGAKRGEGDQERGLARAWAVVDYLSAREGVDKGWLSISASSTASSETGRLNEQDAAAGETERVLEIVLLERSIYN